MDSLTLTNDVKFKSRFLRADSLNLRADSLNLLLIMMQQVRLMMFSLNMFSLKIYTCSLFELFKYFGLNSTILYSYSVPFGCRSYWDFVGVGPNGFWD